MTSAAFALLLSAICQVESGGNPNAINVNDGGTASYGECQVKLSTARMLGYRGRAIALWKNRSLNRFWAGQYLRYQLKRYHGNVEWAVAAYNAGSVRQSIQNPKYVRKVLAQLVGAQ